MGNDIDGACGQLVIDTQVKSLQCNTEGVVDLEDLVKKVVKNKGGNKKNVAAKLEDESVKSSFELNREGLVLVGVIMVLLSFLLVRNL